MDKVLAILKEKANLSDEDLNTIKETWGGKTYLMYRGDQWSRIIAYYNKLSK